MSEYHKYKDSGIEWIGEIPQGWEVKKLKFVCEITYGISPPDTTYNDSGIGKILINGPAEYSLTEFGLTRSLKWTTEPKKFASKGSLLFCLRGSTTGRMNITHSDVSIGRGVCSLNSIGSQQFLIYSMLILRETIQEQISGSTFPSVTKDDVDNYLIPYPPLPEQQQIVTFLDQRTTLIDQIISGSEKKIELLKEQRTATINHAVTKGLNPKVKMKDSGVEWIGEIPEGWEVKKLKHLTDYKNGAAFKSDDFSDESEIPVIRIGDVSDNINFLECAKVPISFLKTYSDFVIQKESILIGLTGGTIGKSCHFKSDVSCLLNQRVCSLVNNENLNNKLLYYYVKSQVFITYIFYNCYGGGQDNIGKSDIINMIFPLPPQQEQQQIVNFLDQKTKEIDDLISSEQKRIELMKEYRQSMISEVVTGKIKVTNE